MEAFIHGFLLAFGLILPMGIQNIFILNQGINQPAYIKALPAIITASICDTILITVAVLSLSSVAQVFDSIQTPLIIGGFLFLLYIGWSIWKSSTTQDSTDQKPLTAKKQIAFALSVSLLNPHALLDTIGVIGTNSILYTSGDKWMFMMACILVSWMYFAGLGILGRIIGQKDKGFRFRTALNKLSAITIWILAFYMLFSL